MNPLIFTVLKISSIGFLAGLSLVLAFQLLTGSINTRGLITDKVTGTLSPARVQLIFFTIAGALYYLYHTVQAEKFVPLNNELLMAIGGSSVVYISGKTYTVFRYITKGRKYLNLIK
jgi:hypothetical protein